MQAVMTFAAKAATGAAAKAIGGGMAGAAAKAVGAMSGGKALGNMSRGLSVLGSVMEFAGQRQRAAAMDQEARDEALASRQEYVTAAERVNAIDERYNALVGEQMVTAAAMGIDVGSGSVVAARDAARDAADRERTIIRHSAEASARQRFLRSLNLREGAKNARLGSVLALGLGAASAFAG